MEQIILTLECSKGFAIDKAIKEQKRTRMKIVGCFELG